MEGTEGARMCFPTPHAAHVSGREQNTRYKAQKGLRGRAQLQPQVSICELLLMRLKTESDADGIFCEVHFCDGGKWVKTSQAHFMLVTKQPAGEQ